MCGRYVQIKSRREYETYVRALRRGPLAQERPSWNVAPSTTSWAVRSDADGLIVERLTWGIEGTNGLLSNARLETAAEKPAFREAWRTSRAIVPVEGWYEWRRNFEAKEPYYFTPSDGEPVLLAALVRGGRFTLITAETRGALREIHTRRPVALPRERLEEWCDPVAAWTAADLEAALVPEAAYAKIPVSSDVNSIRNEGPQLIERRAPGLRQAALPFG